MIIESLMKGDVSFISGWFHDKRLIHKAEQSKIT